MNMNDKPRFTALHKRLTDAYQHLRGDEGYLEACFVALAPFPLAVVEATYREAVTSPRFGSFFPKPGELAGLAQEISALSGMKSPEEWGREWFAFIRVNLHHMKERGHTQLNSQYDTQAAQAVRNCGGLAGILKGDGDAAESRFLKAYCALEANYQDGSMRPLKEGEDPNNPRSPRRGRILKQALQAVAISAREGVTRTTDHLDGRPRLTDQNR